MKRLFFIGVFGCLAAGLAGCTTAQVDSFLGRADQSIGGTPLVAPASPAAPAATQPSATQPSAPPAPTTTQLVIHLVQDASTEAAPIVATFSPIAAGVLGLLSTLLGFFGYQQTLKLSAANTLIQQAAPQVAALVGQATDGKTLATDVTTVAQLAPGVLSLIAHPSAAAALAEAPALAAAVKAIAG